MKIVVLFFLIVSLAQAAPEIGFDTDLLKFGYISEGGEHSRTLRVINYGNEALSINSPRPQIYRWQTQSYCQYRLS